MRVVVTGGAGRVGRRVAEHLSACGHDVLTIDCIETKSNSVRSGIVNLQNVAELQRAINGADGVVHMARVPFPYASAGYDATTRTWRKPDALADIERFNANVAMTQNILAVSQAEGVKKIVIGSSLAVYGFYYPSRFIFPDYLPIDESHVRRPDDPYGLTKLLGEDLADGFASKGAMDIVSLRFPVVYVGDKDKLLQEQTTGIRGFGAFWTYLHVDDAAEGCRLALAHDLRGHHTFNLCAPTTLMPEPTIDLVRKLVPEITDFRRTERSSWAGYDTTKARAVLGFEAKNLITF